MPKRLVGMFYGEVIPGRIIQLRQGLDPLAKLDSHPHFRVSGSGNCFAVAPDGSAAVLGNRASSDNMRYFSDPANLVGVSIPMASFAGYVNCCAINETLYAFGGDSPYLYVFDRATHALVTLNTSGLGEVIAMDFSPDGSRLALAHDKTPYVRIYSTSDWSIVNADTPAPGYPSACCFSKDSSKLVVCTSSSPYVTIYNASTGVREASLTRSSDYSITSGSSYGLRAVRSPLRGDDRVIFAASSDGKIATVDTQTHDLQLWAAANPRIGSVNHLVVDPDPDEDALYAFHYYGNTLPSRTITKYRISTGTPFAGQPAIFRNVCWGSSTPYGACGIVMTDAHTLTGTVRDVDNAPAARVVRAYSRATGELLAQTTSDAATGNYALKVYDAGPYDIQFMTAEGELLNDLFFARAEPQAVSG